MLVFVLSLLSVFSLTLLPPNTFAQIPSIDLGKKFSHQDAIVQSENALESSSDALVFPETNVTQVNNCRYGVTSTSKTEYPWLDAVYSGSFITFNWFSQTDTPNTAHIPMVRFRQSKDANGNRLPQYIIIPSTGYLGSLAAQKPGQLWLLGNEPDRVAVQDDIEPALYAQAFHEAYLAIKSADPTARIGNAGLVQFSPNRQQYLTKVWDAYRARYNAPMPVDVWNMHVYILPEKRLEPTLGKDVANDIASVAIGTDLSTAMYETVNFPRNQYNCSNPDDQFYCYAEHDNMTVFRKQVTAMRQWMKDRGQQNKPLIISEWSILYPYEVDSPTSCFIQDENGQCFTPQRVNNYMKNTLSYLENTQDANLGYAGDNNRLVQQWYWFSMYSSAVGYVSNFLNPDHAQTTNAGDLKFLTSAGLTYRSEATKKAIRPNLTIRVGSSESNGQVSLSAFIQNNGSAYITQPIKLTFYADAAMTTPIGSVTVPAQATSCAGLYVHQTVPLVWVPSAGQKTYRFWAKIDSDNLVVEEKEDDNVSSGFGLLNPPHKIALPVVFSRY